MSLRVKTILVIIFIVVFFTGASFTITRFFTRRNIAFAMEQDLTLACDIAEGLVTTKINLLAADAHTIAERLVQSGAYEHMIADMDAQLELYPDFLSLTVYDRNGVYANVGPHVNDDASVKESAFIQNAFYGISAITSTHYIESIDELIMHLFTPMGHDYVLSVTIHGMLFTRMLEGYKLWDTGSIFLIDDEGTIIANYRDYLITDRRNFIRDAAVDPSYSSIGNFYRGVLENEKGVGQYILNGTERVAAYKKIPNSDTDWHLLVSVPLNESPAALVQYDMMLSSSVFLAIGIIISIFLSKLAVKPFLKIEMQNRSLAELNETVRSVSDAKTRFLANMSHEMRTPLNAIIGLSELTLETGDLGEESYINIEKVYNAGTTLLSTVNDILDISKIEAGKLELISTDYTLPSLINDSITQNMLRIGEKPIQFRLDIDDKLPMHLYGDELRIKQIISNLLSNAFKYTKRGEVSLRMHCERDGDSVWLTFKVSDTGIGLNEADIQKLFNDYIQIDKLSNRKIEGTGLGLPITKMIADMMDGTISVESEFGSGSVFTVKVRQAYVSDEKIGWQVAENLKNFKYTDSKRHTNSRLTYVSLPFARVLIVDDIEANLDVARGMMKHYNMQIDCFDNGQQAIDAIRDEKVRYNAVFMDHMMPDMDGIEAVRIIRTQINTEYARSVPIIALTANAIVGADMLFINNGFQAFLSKPIEIARLDEIIRRWIRDKMLEEEMQYMENAVSEQTEDLPPAVSFPWRVDGINLQKGFERLDYDEESFIQVLRSFVSGTKPLIHAAEAVSRENLDDYAIIVHGIKGSSRGVGAEAAGAQAEALEKAARAKNISFIGTHNQAFVENINNLLRNLEDMLEKYSENTKKHKKDAPAPELVAKLLEACEGYDMDGVDAAMEEIEEFEYVADDGLALWLRENVDQMNFTAITQKLSAIPDKKQDEVAS